MMDEQRSVLAFALPSLTKAFCVGDAKKDLKCDLSGQLFEILDTGMSCPSDIKRLDIPGYISSVLSQMPYVNSSKGSK